MFEKLLKTPLHCINQAFPCTVNLITPSVFDHFLDTSVIRLKEKRSSKVIVRDKIVHVHFFNCNINQHQLLAKALKYCDYTFGHLYLKKFINTYHWISIYSVLDVVWLPKKKFKKILPWISTKQAITSHCFLNLINFNFHPFCKVCVM